MLYLGRLVARKTTTVCSENITKSSKIICNIFSRSASSESFPLDHQIYGVKNKRNNSPVLIIHGMLGSKRNWHTFCKSYSEQTGQQVIAIDCRNHGQSPWSDQMNYSLMAGDIVETLKQLDIPKTILIGHSMGGKVAMETALSMPSVVEKLILVDITPSPAMTKVGTVSMVPMVLSAVINLDLNQIKSRRDADDLMKESVPFDGLRAWVLTNLYKDKKGQFHWYINTKSVQENVETLFSGIELNEREPYMKETLFIGGGESDVLRNVDMNEMRKMFPKAELQMITGAGHFVHSEKPKEFLEIIKNFLK